MARPLICAASSAGTSSRRSTRSSCGTSSRRTKSRTVETMARCSSLGPKSMAVLLFGSPGLALGLASARLASTADAHDVAYRRGYRQHGVRRPDRLKPAAQVVGHRDDPAAGRVDVHEQLFGRRHFFLRGHVADGMKNVQALRSDVEQVQGNRELVAGPGLAEMMQVGLRG